MTTTNNHTIIAPGDPRYPPSLSRFYRQLPNLTVAGNIELLSINNTVGFCGSRKAHDTSIQATGNCIEQLTKASRDIVVVSGNANGVDLEAHWVALKHGLNTIMVLPEGINYFRIKPKLQPVWNWNNVLIISQFSDNARWKSWQAMNRNSTILALSNVMIVVEVGEKGGTKAAAETAISKSIPLFVIDYRENPVGNKLLIEERNTYKIRKNRRTGLANVSELNHFVFQKNTPKSIEQFNLPLPQ